MIRDGQIVGIPIPANFIPIPRIPKKISVPSPTHSPGIPKFPKKSCLIKFLNHTKYKYNLFRKNYWIFGVFDDFNILLDQKIIGNFLGIWDSH